MPFPKHRPLLPDPGLNDEAQHQEPWNSEKDTWEAAPPSPELGPAGKWAHVTRRTKPADSPILLNSLVWTQDDFLLTAHVGEKTATLSLASVSLAHNKKCYWDDAAPSPRKHTD